MPSRRQFLGALAAAPVATAALSAQTSPAGAASPNELAVMTYNLRYASTQPPNDWPTRRPVVRALLQQYRPDVVGTQEGVYHQLKDVATDLPDYEWIGLGRDGGSRGEFMAVFYRRDRLEPLEYDHFWLSDTPEVIASTTWGNTNRRMVSWVRFRDRRAGREFYFWNTHLDHQIQAAREKAAALILERIRSAADAKLPLLLVGDFNAVAKDNRVYDQLVGEGGLQDTWFAAQTRRNETANSFNGFETLRHEGKRIDWILARGGLSVRATEVITFKQGDQWPSDHLPVMAWLTWN